jgi:hypothetical protein
LTSLCERFGGNDEEVSGWRKVEALRMLPLHREVARIAQWEDEPLPTDEELIQRELSHLNRWPSRKEWLAWDNNPLPHELIALNL